MDDAVLSILVISHNQRTLLGRCLDSVLAQRLSCSFEVVVSDDRSTDGTWELIEQYQRDFPGMVFGYHCNSDECNPITRSERCGWNKLNAYRHARGKYMVNIDADDYLKSNDIYQLQVDALESHPECSLCQQRVWQVKDGEDLTSGFAWPQSERLYDGAILTAYDTIVGKLRGVNPSYMIRRNTSVDVVEKYGKWYDDTVITLHHLQFGNVVFVDRADYVWVQYAGSINSSLTGDDNLACFGLLPLHHAQLIPSFSVMFMEEDNLPLFHLLQKLLNGNLQLHNETKEYIAQYEGYINQSVLNKKTQNKLRTFCALLLLWFIRKFHIHNMTVDRTLFGLLINRSAVRNITREKWKVR